MDFEDEEFIKREQSDELLFEAYDEPIKSKAIKLAKKALEINPDNIDAENFITKFETNTIRKLKRYKETLDKEHIKLQKQEIKFTKVKINNFEAEGGYSCGSEAEAYFMIKDYKYLLATVPSFIEFVEREI